MTAGDILPLLGVLSFGLLALMLVQTRYAAWEFQLMLASFALHVVSAFTQIWLARYVYGVGDILTFNRVGQEVSRALRNDFFGVAPEVMKLLFQQEYKLNVFVSFGAASTQSMYAVAGLGNFLCGDSFYATSVAIALGTFFSKVVLYDALKRCFSPHVHSRVLLATLLVPSAVFWSSGVIKEGMAVIGIGPLVMGLVQVIEKKRLGYLVWVAAGGVVVSLFKPHLLFACALAVGVWLYWQRAQGRGGVEFRPTYLVIGAVVGFGGIILLGEAFPKFSLSALGEESAQMQFYAERAGGGSRYIIGDPTSSSLAGQLVFAPLGLFTGLFRPLLIEARNPQMLINALETTGLLLLSIHAVWSRSIIGVWRTLNRQPVLMFCLVLSVILGTMTGLVSANLGTLSRYRMPLMPFFAVLVLVLSAPREVAAQVLPRRTVPRVRPVRRRRTTDVSPGEPVDAPAI